MEQHPEVGLLGGAVELINMQGQVIQTTRPPLEDAEIKSVMLRYNPMCHPAVMMRKEISEERKRELKLTFIAIILLSLFWCALILFGFLIEPH